MEREAEDRRILRVMATVLELQLLAVRQALGEEEVPRVRRRGWARRRSVVDQCLGILGAERRPLHVNELVRLLREREGRVTDRDTVSSALAKKAREGVLVRQSGPATFTLLKGGKR